MATSTVTRPKAKRLWTYDELLAKMPESNQPSELWDGELVMSPSPHPRHQTIVLRIARLLDDFVTQHKMGRIFVSPLDVVLGPRRAVQPDVLFISKSNIDIIQDHIRGSPDLVVEVMSPGTWRRDRVDKKILYEQYNIREYWIVDPEAESIEVYALTAGAYRLHSKAVAQQPTSSKILSGFKIAFAELAE